MSKTKTKGTTHFADRSRDRPRDDGSHIFEFSLPGSNKLSRSEETALRLHAKRIPIKEILEGSGMAVRHLVKLLELKLSAREIAELEKHARTFALGTKEIEL